jgi:acyl-coenzyme A thioesterase PaaI-like protein
MKSLKDNGMCFACGRQNDKGLHLEFSFNEQERRAETTFVPLDAHQGWQGVVHGGIIATLMDESMAKLAQLLGFHALTASLDVRFKDVARTGEPLHVNAEVAKLSKKLIYARAFASRADGGIVAEAQAKLMIV